MRTPLKLTLISMIFLGGLASAESDRQSIKVTSESQQNRASVGEIHPISGALMIKITPRGMKYFETNLSKMINIDVESANFPAMKNEAKVPTKIEDLGLPESLKTLALQMRTLLTDWFVGFSLQNIRPGVEIGETGYHATFSRFALMTDEKLLHQLGKKEGAVLAIELEVKEMNIKLSSIKAYDADDKDLGPVGMEDVQIKTGSEKNPVKIRLPFFVQVNEKGQLQFESLKVEENFQNTDIEMKYQKLITPKIYFGYGSKKFELNPAKLEKSFNENMPQVLKTVQKALGAFAADQLPKLLNEKGLQSMQSRLEETFKIAPPGADAKQNAAPFIWGLQLEKILQHDGIGIRLKAYVEDPQNPKSKPNPEAASRGMVQAKGLEQEQYDMALSVDRGFVNRFLQLSFERGLFDTVKTGAGPNDMLYITAAPRVDFVEPPESEKKVTGETFLKIRVQSRVGKGRVEGYQKLAVKENFEFAFDLIAKLRRVPHTNKIEIVFNDIDADSIWINPKDIKTVGSIVTFLGIADPKESIAGILKDVAKQWKTKEQKLPGSITMFRDLGDLKTEINDMILDPNGFLILYLNYRPTVRPGISKGQERL